MSTLADKLRERVRDLQGAVEEQASLANAVAEIEKGKDLDFEVGNHPLNVSIIIDTAEALPFIRRALDRCRAEQIEILADISKMSDQFRQDMATAS